MVAAAAEVAEGGSSVRTARPGVERGAFPARAGRRGERARHERAQRRAHRAAWAKPHRRHVEVEVGDGPRPRPTTLDELARTDDAVLLGAPEGEDEGARRPCALAGQSGEIARRFERADRARGRVGGAEAPGVVVRADDDLLVGARRAAQARDHVRGAHDLARLLDLEAEAQRVVGERVVARQRAAPLGGGGRALHPAQDLARGAVADRLDGDLRKRDLGRIEPFGILRREAPGRERIAGPGQRPERPALHALGIRPAAALGPGPAAGRSRIGGIGVDDEPDAARLLGELRLVAAEIPAVSRDRDLPARIDPERREPLEILAPPVVHVDDARLDRARARVGVPRDVEVGVRGRGVDREIGLDDAQGQDSAAGGRG